jgi:hypothetical protein
MSAVLRSNKKLILSTALLLLAGLGLFLGSSRLTAVTNGCQPDEPCPCVDDWCTLTANVEGIGEVKGELNGSTTVGLQPAKIDKRGLRTTPLVIKGNAFRGTVDGVGEMMMWLDQSRPVSGSVARSKQAGASFPAVQEMRWHLLMTMEAFPGQTFRSINPFVVRSNHVNAMPPRGAVFNLAQQVDFEDVDNPGVVVASLLKGRAVLNSRWGEGARGVDRFRPVEDAGR